MSEFNIVVVEIGAIEKHPNADTLSITQVFGGYPCIIRTGEFNTGDKAVYIPVDALVPAKDPRFAFLTDNEKERVRIRAKKLRGIFSMGLLTKAESTWEIGQNVQQELNITKWEPDVSMEVAGECEKDPGFMPCYTDIEGLRKYKNVLLEGEEVVLTEKIEGENSRYCWHEDRLWIGSHTRIKKLDGDTAWHRAARKYSLAEKLSTIPGHIIYGETHGYTKGFSYDVPHGEVGLRVFDIRSIEKGQYLDYDEVKEICGRLGLTMVPELYRGPWSLDLMSFAEGTTTLGQHVREGFIVKPVKERQAHVGRVIFKMKGEKYLLSKGKKE